MAGEPLKVVKKLLKFATTYLSENDKIGIVTFDDRVTELLPLTRMTADGVIRVAAPATQLRRE